MLQTSICLKKHIRSKIKFSNILLRVHSIRPYFMINGKLVYCRVRTVVSFALPYRIRQLPRNTKTVATMTIVSKKVKVDFFKNRCKTKCQNTSKRFNYRSFQKGNVNNIAPRRSTSQDVIQVSFNFLEKRMQFFQSMLLFKCRIKRTFSTFHFKAARSRLR